MVFGKMTLFVFFVAFVSVSAQPVVVFSKKTENFLGNRKNISVYRTAQFDGNVADGQDVFKKASSVASIKGLQSEKVIKAVDSEMKAIGYRTKIGRSGELHALPSRAHIVDVSCLNDNSYLCGLGILDDILPYSVRKDFDFLNVSYEYVGDEKEKQISGYVFSYKRVYDNKIVVGSSNSLDVYVKADGLLKSIEIEFDLIENTNDVFFVEADVGLNKAALVDVVNKNFSMVKALNDEDSRINVKRVDVFGVTEAYCPLQSETDVRVFIPCLSYSVKIDLESGDTFTTVINAPYTPSVIP